MNFRLSVNIFMLALSAISSTKGSNTSATNFYLEEVRSLSELPLEKLIKIKSSFSRNNVAMDDKDSFGPEGRTSTAVNYPMTIPGKRISNKSIKRYEEWEEWDEKGKDSKISKIFQLAVTALSFLAFGGYLLTLIITAIRRNQMMNNANQGNVIVLSNLPSLVKLNKRPKRGIFIYDPMENDNDVEKLYRGMLMLSSDISHQYPYRRNF